MNTPSYNWLEKKINFMWLIQEAIKEGYSIRQWKKPQSHDKEDWPIHEIWDSNQKKSLDIARINRYSDLSEVVAKITKDKWTLQKVLTELDLPFPQTYPISSVNEIQSLDIDLTKKWVCKPQSAGLGEDIFFPNDENEIHEYSKHILNKHTDALIQERIIGNDLRIQAIGGQLFAACIRMPASITGDGILTAKQLIDKKNESKIKHNQLKIDEEVIFRLSQHHLGLNGIPKKDQHIQLRSVPNIGQGGDPIDVTELLHPQYQGWIQKIARRLKLKTFALDIICKNEQNEPSTSNAVILEVNAPCMWAHHHFAEGQARNTALALLDSYFDPQNFNPKNPRYLIPKEDSN